VSKLTFKSWGLKYDFSSLYSLCIYLCCISNIVCITWEAFFPCDVHRITVSSNWILSYSWILSRLLNFRTNMSFNITFDLGNSNMFSLQLCKVMIPHSFYHACFACIICTNALAIWTALAPSTNWTTLDPGKLVTTGKSRLDGACILLDTAYYSAENHDVILNTLHCFKRVQPTPDSV